MNEQSVTQQENWHQTLYATHEAGHVIGRCIAEVSIVADKARGYRGYCAFSAFAEAVQGQHQWRDRGQNPECTTIMYAGTVAMAILCERRGWKYERWRGGDKADFDLIYQWSPERFGSDDDQAHAMQRACQKQAREILIQHWNAVDTLTAVLLAQGKVSGREAVLATWYIRSKKAL